MARILVIDDEADVRDLLAELLKRAGHAVEVAAGGEEGLRLFEASPSDLVITDILMPGTGGLTVVSRLRAKTPGLPILVISGGRKDGTLNFLSTARTFPGVHTLQKPFHARQLLDEVEALLGA